MTTAAEFVKMAVDHGMTLEPDPGSMEAFMAVAVMDQLGDLVSANDARKAVLATLAAGAWFKVQHG